jgi:eukaryotic-like serine/threonine-protein kinase
LADARRALELFEGLPSRSGDQWFETASCHAAPAGLAGREGSGAAADLAASEAETAMDLLRKAAGLGYRNTGCCRTEEALDPLRDRDDFRALMLDLAMPADPIAR